MLKMKAFVVFLAGISLSLSAPPPAADCPSSTGEFRPDSSDCSIFYQCGPQGWVSFTCGPGTLYNPDIQVCDWPDNVNCQTTNDPDQCTNGDMVALTDAECSLFKYCVEGVWRDYRCPQGYRFDPTRKDCYNPREYPCPTLACDSSPCQNGGNCTNNNPSFTCTCPSTHTGAMCETPVANDPSAPSGACDTTSYEPDSTLCNRFYACVGNTWQQYQCPTQVPLYNTATGQCDYVYNVDCGTRPVSCVTDTRVPSNDNECTQFYRCVANEWVLYNCPANTRFNSAINDCATGVDCPTATTTTTPCSSSPCQNNEICTDVSATEYRCNCPPYTVGSNCNIDCQYPCPQSVTFIYPDVANKSTAVLCSQGTLTYIPCPAGEEFSPSINRCAAAAPSS